MAKTSDGRFQLSDVVRALEQMPGVRIERGNSHVFVAKYSGRPVSEYAGNCALGPTTSYEHHIRPWVRSITGYDNRTIDTAFSSGVWRS